MDDDKAFLIQRLRYHAKEGDINALRDLIAVLRTIKNPESVLVDVYCSEKCTEEQKKLIKAQERLISKETLDIESTMTLTYNGSIEALKHLILLLKSEKLDLENNERWRGILQGIYFSSSSTPEQKKLIWENKDILVYISVTEHQVYDDGGTYTEKSYQQFSLYDCIKLCEEAAANTWHRTKPAAKHGPSCFTCLVFIIIAIVVLDYLVYR